MSEAEGAMSGVPEEVETRRSAESGVELETRN
jgi:hypothetical protein